MRRTRLAWMSIAGAAVLAAASGGVVTAASTAAAAPLTYGCTGGGQTTTVPAGATQLFILATGAQGGGGGGLGGQVQATVHVTPGAALVVGVGCSPSGTAGGFGVPPGGSGGAGGGGASAVLEWTTAPTPTVLAVAAGGGGFSGGPTVGAGGYPSGGAGSGGASGGGGATTTATGGSGGTGGPGDGLCVGGGCVLSPNPGGDGGLLHAGDGQLNQQGDGADGSGGGGGWYGGGGGGGCTKSIADPICFSPGGGGGGGSSYGPAGASFTTGTNAGDGSVTLSFGAVATTGPATGVTPTSATVTGTVNPQGADTTYSFEYGTTTGYGQTTPVVDAGSGFAPVAVSASLTNLTPGATYHYQLVAHRLGVDVLGGDATFSTAPSADLSITLTATPRPVPVIASVVYTATVHNAGPDAAVQVTATVALPAVQVPSVFTFYVSTTSSSGTCSGPPLFGAGAVTCSLGTLAPGGTVVVQVRAIQVVIPPAAPVAHASVSSPTADPDLSNNMASTLA